jgi:hypothetical protein
MSAKEAQEVIANTIVSTLRSELLKEIDKTNWMYNDRSYT